MSGTVLDAVGNTPIAELRKVLTDPFRSKGR